MQRAHLQNLSRQLHLDWRVGWPVALSQHVHGQLHVWRNLERKQHMTFNASYPVGVSVPCGGKHIIIVFDTPEAWPLLAPRRWRYFLAPRLEEPGKGGTRAIQHG